MPVVTRFAPSPTGSLYILVVRGQPYLTTYMQRKIMDLLKYELKIQINPEILKTQLSQY